MKNIIGKRKWVKVICSKRKWLVGLLGILILPLFFYFASYNICELAASIEVISPYTVFPTDDQGRVGQSSLRNIPLKDINEVFLTFDDGPTRENTTKILEILNKYKVKATFFVIGDLAERNKDIMAMMKDSGMCILPHSYTHDYNIYKSRRAYFKDLEKCIKVIKEVTRRTYHPIQDYAVVLITP